MKKLSFVVATLSLAIAGSTFAQNAENGVTTSTDPAKAAAVERQAAEIKAQSNAASTTTPKMKRTKKHHGKKHHSKKDTAK